MSQPLIAFDRVWKKFNRAPRFNSLRDLLPAMAAGVFKERQDDELHGKEFWALQDISFEVRAGEALGIIGPNGAGKSTALKILTRILRPDRGRSVVRGRVGALVEIAAGFHPDLSGRENVFMQGAIMGMRRAEILQRFDDIVDFAGVSEFIDMPVKRYSSGMNARLGFAVAAHLNPEVLIIDEVLSVGDLAFQERCYERMQAFVKSGIAVVLVSHNLSAISTLCDRTMVLRKGQAEAVVPTHEAITLYTTLVQESRADLGDHAVDVSVLDAAGGAATDVDAGTALTVRVRTGRPRVGERFHGELQIRHVETGTVIYRGQSPAAGGAAQSPVDGQEMELLWTIRANLGRGHYSIRCAILNELHKWVAFSPPSLITINERQSEQALLFLDAHCQARVLSPVDRAPQPQAVAS